MNNNMNLVLYTSEEIIDGLELEVWRLDEGDGQAIINISKLFDYSATDCDWISDNKKFISLLYSDGESEYWAIINTKGEIVKMSLRNIVEYLEKYDLFIVSITGVGLGMQSKYYDVDDDDWKMVVIDRNGNLVVEPYSRILFDDVREIFVADNFSEMKDEFTIRGVRRPNKGGKEE